MQDGNLHTDDGKPEKEVEMIVCEYCLQAILSRDSHATYRDVWTDDANCEWCGDLIESETMYLVTFSDEDNER